MNSYNETRLKNHIIDPYRGCRKIPEHVRERIRAAHARAGSGAAALAAVVAATQNGGIVVPPQVAPEPQTQPPPPPPPPPPAKRKREPSVVEELQPPPPTLIQAQTAGDTATGAQLNVSVEFSMLGGGLLRAQWIVAEIIQEFHRDVIVVSLVPTQSESVFNIWIGGKLVWSRGPGQPLPDFEHLRPLVRAHVQHCQ